MADVEAPPTEATPLVGGDGSLTKPPSPDNEPPPLQEMKEQSLKEKVVASVAAVTFGTSIAAMVVESNPIIYASGTIGCVVAPYTVMQQEKLTQVEALRQTNKRMSEEVDQLKYENNRLKSSVEELEVSVKNLNEMEETLAAIQATEGQSLDELEKQLEQSEEILSKMQSNLKGDVIQNLITAVLAADDNNDMKLSEKEIDKLILQLEGLAGVDIKNDLLKERIMQKGADVKAILDLCKELMTNEEGQESLITFIEKKGLVKE